MNTGQESTTSIQDSLNDLIKPEETSNTCDNKGTVEYIINKKINSIEDYLNTKVINMYQRPWNKLELKLKLRKIEDYFKDGPVIVQSEPTKRKSTKKNVEAFENYELDQIRNFCKSNEKKNIKIDYDYDVCKINSILVII